MNVRIAIGGASRASSSSFGRRRACHRLATLVTIHLALLSWSLAAPYEAAGSVTPPQATGSTATVTYISGSSVYIDSGRSKGLNEGDLLSLMRHEAAVATLKVVHLSEVRAACEVEDGSELPIVGDVVQLPGTGEQSGEVPQLPDSGEAATSLDEPTPAELAPELPTQRAVRSARDRRLRGRLGVRYLLVRDSTEIGLQSEFSQPAADVRLIGNNLAAGHIDLALDVRSRRTYRTLIAGVAEPEDLTRVYRAALAFHDRPSKHRLTIGRQFSPALATVSIFDGVLADLNRANWSIGLFGGTQPDPLDYGYSRDVVEYGGFMQLHNKPGTITQWSLTTGVVGSYQGGIVNREFGYVQVLFAGPRFSLFLTQELDFNRDWKILDGEDQFALTSTFANLSWRLSRGFSLRAGYDNRRNIRLYRDHVTPETDFDDSYRTGIWAGFTQRFRNRLYFGVDAKTNRGEIAEPSDSYTLTLGVGRISRANLSLNYRGTYITNETLEGMLHALNTGVSIGRRVRLSALGGLREDTHLLDVTLSQRLFWYGMGLDVSLGRHFFVQLSAERTEGQLNTNDQAYFGTTYRF